MHYSIFQSPNNVHARIITPSCEDMYICRVVYEVLEVKHFFGISKCLFPFLYAHMSGRVIDSYVAYN